MQILEPHGTVSQSNFKAMDPKPEEKHSIKLSWIIIIIIDYMSEGLHKQF